MPIRFVVDNSVVMTWCFESERNAYTDSVLESLTNTEAVVPAIWPLEVGDVVLVAERKRRLSKASAAHFLALLSGLPILVEQETPERMLRETLALAREQGLSTYDASYLDLAMRLNISLCTQDIPLLKAAENCQVPLYQPT